MGREIVRKCANVPLAIKVVGSLLYGQGKNKWQFIQHSGLSEIGKGENGIMPALKFSYYHLPPFLKSCFSYCAVFPKDLVIQKERLISLWMAQGYIEPLDGHQNIEDVGEEYFQILLQRCFFQDIEKDEYGEVISCKIHDLMHDVAQEVAGKQICIANSTTSSLDKKTLHIYFEAVRYPEAIESYVSGSKIRTYLHSYDLFMTKNRQFDYSTLSKLRNLRTLELSNIGITILSDAIGELLHLRYLNLSCNGFEMLPDSIIKLFNLQTFNLAGCFDLIQLPKDFYRLVRLRALDLELVPLSYMPSGMEKLTNLCRLNAFVVAERDSSLQHCEIGELASLGALRKLKGHLVVKILPNYNHVQRNPFKGGYLSNKEPLSNIVIEFNHRGGGCHDNVEDLIRDLQPHSNLKGLEIRSYCGVRIPRWANLRISLPNLVKVVIYQCKRLQELPLLSKLRFLKTLTLKGLFELEYMENTASYGEAIEALSTSSLVFFPSLEELELCDLPKLKGWWGDDVVINNGRRTQIGGGHQLPSFPCLSKLGISLCPSLTVMPLCLTVETLYLKEFNKRLQIMMKSTEDQKEVGGSQHFGDSKSHDPKLKFISLSGNVSYLNSLPMWAFRSLTKLYLRGDHEVESLSDIGGVLQSCSSSLQSLAINNFHNLRSLSRGLEYLTTLDSLYLQNLRKLRFSEEEEKEGMPWRCLHQCLHSLELYHGTDLAKGMCHLTSLQSLKIDILDKLETLPEWIGCLSSLQLLEINHCRLQSLPEAMRKLTSLQRLRITFNSRNLEIRCQGPDGEDWPKIQHIPHIWIRETF